MCDSAADVLSAAQYVKLLCVVTQNMQLIYTAYTAIPYKLQ